MNRIIRLIQSYLVCAVPFVLACMAWGTIVPENERLQETSAFSKVVWELLSWNLMLWFAVLIVFLAMLVLLPTAREKTLKRLANLKERDEREQYITGKASRSAYISTLSLLIFFLFFSIFSLNIYRAPESEAINGKRGTLSIGLNFSLLDKSEDAMKTRPSGEMLFESKDIPLSKTAILFILIIWQVSAFNLTARRENIRETSG